MTDLTHDEGFCLGNDAVPPEAMMSRPAPAYGEYTPVTVGGGTADARTDHTADLQAENTPVARPEADWYDDDGPVTWWKFPIEEAPWIGTPLDSDWPGYHTHFTPAPAAPAEPST